MQQKKYVYVSPEILLRLTYVMLQAVDDVPPSHLLRVQMLNFFASKRGNFFFFLLGTSYSPQENSHNHSALHSSNSHSSNPSNNPSKTSDAVSIFDWYLSLHQSPHSNRHK